MITAQQQSEMLGLMIEGARRQPGGVLKITDGSGAVVAELRTFDLAKRPRDMPRHLRPKARLSKRQRDAAKREKLRNA